MSLWKSLKPVSVVSDFWKEFKLFIKIKILELFFFYETSFVWFY